MGRDRSTLAARWVVLGEWRAQPWRIVVSALAIAVGVALGLAVHIVNASALSEFSSAVSAVNGDAELQVDAVSPRGFAEGVYPVVARSAGIAAASPVVEVTATTERPDERLTVLGLDVFRAAQVTPRLLGRPLQTEAGGAPTPTALLDDDAIFLSRTAMRGRRVGEEIGLSANGRVARFRIAGVLSAVEDGRRVAVIDIASAQWRLGALGRLQRIDLRLSPGADEAAVRAGLRGVLPRDAFVSSRRDRDDRSDSLSRAYRVNLEMLALVALLTGGFLVYSAQSLAVARRRPQFALLRVLGLRRRALLVQVMAEGAAVGLIGSLMGLAAGYGVAAAVLAVLGGDLGGGYFGEMRPSAKLDPAAALIFLGLGVATALIGSLGPAREAARAQPAVALKNLGDAIDPARIPRIWPALGAAALGAVAALGPPVAGVPVLGYAAMALLLAAGVAAMPRVARMLTGLLVRRPLSPPPVALAAYRLWGAPSQAAVALCGVVASTSLMVAMAVMVTSFRGSVEAWLDQVLAGDLYLRFETAGAGGGFSPQDQARMRRAPGVASIGFLGSSPLQLAADRPPVVLVARPEGGLDAGAPPMIGRSLQPPAGFIPVYVSEPGVWIYGWKAGDRIALPVGAADLEKPRFFVAGVWRDYARQHGAVTLDSRDFTALTGQAARTEASVRLQPGATPQMVARDLLALLPAETARRVEVAEPASIRAVALKVFDRSFAVTYGLEAIAVLVGLAGVAATISAQTLARTKEFGMLRHVGATRRQIVAMLAMEGALLGTVGALAGVGLGLVMSQVLIHVVNPQSFHWTMDTRLPWELLIGVTFALIAASAGTAALAGRRAVSRQALQAVREDW